MPLKLSVGVSQKVGLPNYGSVGASCNLEMELDTGLLEKDLDGFHARIRAAYVAAHQAVHDELARLHAPANADNGSPSPARARSLASNGTTRANGNGAVATRSQSDRTRAPRPATANQVRRSRQSHEGRTPTWWVCCATSTRSSGPRISRFDRPAS